MPRFDGIYATLRAQPDQKRGADEITKEGEQCTRDHEENAPRDGKRIKFAEKK